ncbi:MAG: hypothetical protein GYA17_06050, partial [Chloroflexi bacterium]|nr:hypothetical protein [Chloroflexota bacterium]
MFHNLIFRADFSRHKVAQAAWLAVLYVVGVLGWGQFLNWGQIPFDFHDWAEINAPRLTFLKDAVTRGVLPLHMPDKSALSTITDRYMAIPDVFLSPQAVLLRYMDVGVFVLVNLILVFSLGYVALLLLRRRMRLSLFTFTILFLLFNFNGYITAHTSVGHVTWSGYFLFPWLALLVFDLLEHSTWTWGWVAKTSLLLFVIFLQGSFHHFVWWLAFLALLGVSNPSRLLPCVSAILGAVGVSMVRILPATLLLGQFNTEYHGGFFNLLALLRSAAVMYLPGQVFTPPVSPRPVGAWEFDIFVGLVGLAYLLYFGLWCNLKDVLTHAARPVLLLPLLGMAILSMGDVYGWISSLPIPFLTAERVSARFIVIPLFFLILLASRQFQHSLDHSRLSPLA